MKALSVQQPWAWLIVHGYKDVENRTWPTRQRGRIAIHAGRTVDHAGYHWVRETFPEVPLPPIAALERGGTVGTVTLTDCVRTHPSRWFFGPFGFVMADAAPTPVRACRGALGFFEVPDEFADRH
jgi:hypothetical protein